MNRVLGYRKMAGLTQADMARELGISEATYRLKEKGRYSFKDTEISKIISVFKRVDSSISITDIFFTS